MLEVCLQAGLSALKTHTCNQLGNMNINCPVCQLDSFGKLAKELPMAQHVNSTIVCRISGNNKIDFRQNNE